MKFAKASTLMKSLMIMISNDFLTIIFVTILRALGLALGRNWGIFTVCGIIHWESRNVPTHIYIYTRMQIRKILSFGTN